MGILDRAMRAYWIVGLAFALVAVSVTPTKAQILDAAPNAPTPPTRSDGSQPIPIKVVSARWGAGDKAVDVTERVATLLNAGQAVSPQQLASVDPAPGTYKTLAVCFEIEKQTFIFAADEAYGRLVFKEVIRDGLAAAPLKVISARWGTAEKGVDVTKRFAELLEAGGTIDQRPETLKQEDPADNVRKSITVEIKVGDKIVLLSSEALSARITLAVSAATQDQPAHHATAGVETPPVNPSPPLYPPLVVPPTARKPGLSPAAPEASSNTLDTNGAISPQNIQLRRAAMIAAVDQDIQTTKKLCDMLPDAKKNDQSTLWKKLKTLEQNRDAELERISRMSDADIAALLAAEHAEAAKAALPPPRPNAPRLPTGPRRSSIPDTSGGSTGRPGNLCPQCNGLGRYGNSVEGIFPCPQCGGTGRR